MKALRYSCITLATLGTLSFVNAETTSTEKVDKTIPPSTKNSLLDALKNVTISGYAYGRYTSMFGKDANGSSFRTRTAIDVDTGAYEGFSVGTRIFASQGGSSIDGGTLLENSKNPTDLTAITLQVLYGRMTFQSTATVIEAGKINIVTPFTDTAWDAGYGASIRNYDIAGLTFNLQAYGAWGLDNSNTVNPGVTASNHTMVIAGITGNPKEFGVGFNAWVAHSTGTINFLAYGDVQYSIAGVALSGKVAATQVKADNMFFKSASNIAELRGIYNIQAAYSLGDTTISGGYTGSFGDGYGALLNNAAFNMGGNIWWDTEGSGNNGYGILGAGATKNSNGNASTIMVAYVSLKYKGIKSLSMGLDYAFVSGDNNYSLMKKGRAARGMTNKNATLHEVSATLGYAFSPKLSLSGVVGSTFGDLSMGRARVTLNYSF